MEYSPQLLDPNPLDLIQVCHFPSNDSWDRCLGSGHCPPSSCFSCRCLGWKTSPNLFWLEKPPGCCVFPWIPCSMGADIPGGIGAGSGLGHYGLDVSGAIAWKNSIDQQDSIPANSIPAGIRCRFCNVGNFNSIQFLFLTFGSKIPAVVESRESFDLVFHWFYVLSPCVLIFPRKRGG